MAHKRLAILDLSKNAKQPMISKDGKWTIVFNGCIYNFKNLKKELKKKGCQFISSSIGCFCSQDHNVIVNSKRQ